MPRERGSVLRLAHDDASLPHRRDGGILAAAGEYAFFYAGLFAFAAISLSWSLLGSALYAVLPRKTSSAIGPGIVTNFAKAYLALLGCGGKVRFDLRALDALRDDGGIIIAPNHPTMLDAVMILSRLPRIVCISKAELWDNPLLGGGMRMAGYIRNDTPIKLTKLAVAKLRQGQQLLLFPEGTRTTEWPLNRFRGGFALMAKMAGVPVQTVFIETNSPFLTKGWPALKKPPMPLEYRVRLGRRFEAGGDVKQLIDELERYFRAELDDTHGWRPEAR